MQLVGRFGISGMPFVLHAWKWQISNGKVASVGLVGMQQVSHVGSGWHGLACGGPDKLAQIQIGCAFCGLRVANSMYKGRVV